MTLQFGRCKSPISRFRDNLPDFTPGHLTTAVACFRIATPPPIPQLRRKTDRCTDSYEGDKRTRPTESHFVKRTKRGFISCIS